MGRKSALTQAMKNTNYKWQMYFQKLTMLALSCYKWENLPNTIDERFLELGLFENGHMLYFRHKYLGDLCLNANLAGLWDFYNIPSQRYAYSTTGFMGEYNEDNSVIIFNNYLRTPTIYVVQMYVDQLVNLSDAINVNINAQKTPFIIKTSLNKKLTMENAYKRINGNQPYLIVDEEGLDLDDIKILRTDAPIVFPSLYQQFTNIYNEYLSYLGIENMGYSVVKAERLTGAEGFGNEGNVEMGRNSWLLARQQAAEKINKMFGTNISVTFNSQLPSLIQALKGGENNGDMDSVFGRHDSMDNERQSDRND